jgi:hypothetical protein
MEVPVESARKARDPTHHHAGCAFSDFYLVQATRRQDGKYATTVTQKIFGDYPDRRSRSVLTVIWLR